MIISINRQQINRLYTMGELRINGLRQTYCVEASECMLPVGSYILRIVKHSARKQSLCIFPCDSDSHSESPISTITLCHSWVGCKKLAQSQDTPSPSLSLSPIAIGLPLMPGAMHKGTKDFERITDRLMKATQRGEDIDLIISEANATHGQPISWWLQPRDHGCPPTRQTVELHPNGDITVHYPDGTSKLFPEAGIPAKASDDTPNTNS